MYLIDEATLYNTAVVGDTIELKAKWDSNKPAIAYTEGGKLTIPVGGTDVGSRILEVTPLDPDGDVIYIKILITGNIAYSLADINVEKEIDT